MVGWCQPPVVSVSGFDPRQIVQTRGAAVILSEYGPDLRVIPFTDRHGPLLQGSALGDAIAHWEGETLVIETVGMPSKDAIRPFPTLFVPASAKVIERYTRVSKPSSSTSTRWSIRGSTPRRGWRNIRSTGRARRSLSPPAAKAPTRSPTSWRARGSRCAAAAGR